MLMKEEKDAFLRDRLAKRAHIGALRGLPPPTEHGFADFTSNDYLGLARSGALLEAVAERIEGEYSSLRSGATGSRLLSGNSRLAEALESRIAAFHRAPAGLIFNSGYDANLGLFSALPQQGDSVLYDECVHASVRDGIRLSRAASFPFRHNDLDHLEQRLHKTRNRLFVAVESVYSMDGDEVPLAALAGLCERYGAFLIVDEAHATGIFGEAGRGKVTETQCEARVFARVHTFSKALGCHGAIVLGSHALRDYLINFSRAFIYTTALPSHSLLAIDCAYQLFPVWDEARHRLFKLINHFLARKKEQRERQFLPGQGPIQGIIAAGNETVRQLSLRLREFQIDARPILSPTVQRTRERVRLTLHAFNTQEEIDRIFKASSLEDP
jgi:7-keto-8-aminopelargonate synthetase and related enzymes